jgi:hypothetical protein
VNGNSNPGFARLFFGDAGIVLLLLNDARHRIVLRGVVRSTRGSALRVATAPQRLRAFARDRYGGQ